MASDRGRFREAFAPAHTGSGRRTSDTSYRVAKGASGRSLARRPCPQLPQGHPGMAKSHLTKDKPVSARCKDRLSYRRAYRQTYRMVSYVGLTDRQTGRPYRQTYLKLSTAGSLGSSLPPTLPTGFVSQTFRPPDRQTCRMVSYASLTDRQTGLPYRQPYLKLSPAGSHGSSLPDGFIRQTYRTPAQPPNLPAGFVPAARPACLTSSPTGSLTGQPHQPALPTALPAALPVARPASLTSSPTDQPSQPNQPARPAIHPGKGPAGLPYR